ncbi:reverse transcriptase domain-containing protein [Tanacetum coccineum]
MPLLKSPIEIYATSEGKSFLRPPSRMFAPAHCRDRNKYWKDQVDWKKKIAETKAVNEVLMTNKKWSPPCHESRTSQPSISIAFSSNDPILEHCNGDNQLIIKADIRGCMIHHIYMDRGSSTEIMYEHCFQQLSNEEKASIRSLTSPLVGFCRPGIEANPEKVKVVVDMMSPRTIREVQSLNGKLAALGRLLAKSIEKALSCFKMLKGRAAQYSWHKGRMCKGRSTSLAKHYRDQRASRSDGSRAGLILTDLDGKEITYALRFDSPTSNNKAEYETLIAGLELALRLEHRGYVVLVQTKHTVSSKKRTLDHAGPMQGPGPLYKRPQGKVKGQWVEELPNVLWAHRTTAKTGNHCTPFSLVYGSEAVLPPEIGVPTYRIQSYKENKNNADLRINLELLEELREIASLCESKYKCQTERYYNSKVRHVYLNVGDFVKTKQASKKATRSS